MFEQGDRAKIIKADHQHKLPVGVEGTVLASADLGDGYIHYAFLPDGADTGEILGAEHMEKIT